MRPVLVFGASGQMAGCLRRQSTPAYPVITCGRPQADITDLESVRRTIQRVGPSAVINAAAYTNVDEAESAEETAFLVNETGAHNLALACRDAAVPLIHYSTDCVFDGRKTSAYVEDDTPAPIGVYGRSKLAGEEAITAVGGWYAIVRVSWIFSPHAASFVTRMLDLARARDRLGVVYEEVGRPSYGPALAKATLTLAEKLTADPQLASDIFHLAGPDPVSRFEFAERIFEESAKRGGPSCPIDPIPSAAYPAAARRPQNAQLDSRKIKRLHGIALPEWGTGLRATLDAILVEGASA